MKQMREVLRTLLQNLFTVSLWAQKNYQQNKDYHTNTSICHINLARISKLRGGERQTGILVHALAAEGGHKQHVIIWKRGPLTNLFDDVPDVKVYKVRNRLSALLVCLSVKRGEFLLHAHDTQGAQIAYLASLFGHKYIITRRIPKSIRLNPISSAKYRKALVVVALTKAVESSIQNSFSDIPTTRIPSAWCCDSPDPSVSQKIRTQFAGKFLVGHAAAMDHSDKGHLVLLRAARILQSDFPDIHFILLGTGRLEKELRQEANDLNNVYFAGWVENPLTWINSFDAFAFPSLQEALGSVLLDAMRTGCPIVASRTGGIPEIITKDCGILVPPGDAEALGEKLVDLFQSPSLRQRLADACVSCSKQYSPEVMAKRYMKVYQSLSLNSSNDLY